MTKERFRNVIRFDDKRLTLASHCYTRVVARCLEVLASYVGQPNLRVIMSRMVLKMIKGLVVYFEIQIGDWLSSLNPKNVQTRRKTRNEEDDDICDLEDDDKLSLEFIFDQSIRMEGFL